MAPQEAQTMGMRRSGSETDFSEAEGGPREYRVRKSSLIGLINWSHVFTVYSPHIFVAALVALIAQLIPQLITLEFDSIKSSLSIPTVDEVVATIQSLRELPIFNPAIEATIVILIVVGWVARMENPIYLMAFSTFKAPESWKVTHEDLINIMKTQNVFTEESITFMRKILDKSGTGQATAWPPGIVQSLSGVPADRSIEASRKEAETVIFDIVEKALKEARVHPKDIDFLVINCSLFSPTPSLCAMVLNKFGMRENCQTYNLSGMGCSASLISIELAKQLLQTRKNKNSGLPFGGGGTALVVSTEIITPNLYHGNERGFLLQNTLFRCGGAAMVLSNKWSDGRRAWYKLLHNVRVQGSDQKSYECVYETEDKNGERGVVLSKEIVKVAGKCMEKNLTRLGPYVLPFTEQAKVVYSIVARKISKMVSKSNHPKIYVPDFKRAVDHFCIHAGGRAVIDGIEKNMQLEPYHTEPSRMTLLNYGNTSSSSIWYELEYIHYHQKTNALKKGDRIMQVAFGSGFKCTSAVWLKL